MAAAEEAFKLSTPARLPDQDFRQAPASGLLEPHSGVHLTDDQKAAFRADGFLVIENLTNAQEIASLCTAYDRLFTERRGWENGDLFDMVGRGLVGQSPGASPTAVALAL